MFPRVQLSTAAVRFPESAGLWAASPGCFTAASRVGTVADPRSRRRIQDRLVIVRHEKSVLCPEGSGKLCIARSAMSLRLDIGLKLFRDTFDVQVAFSFADTKICNVLFFAIQILIPRHIVDDSVPLQAGINVFTVLVDGYWVAQTGAIAEFPRRSTSPPDRSATIAGA